VCVVYEHCRTVHDALTGFLTPLTPLFTPVTVYVEAFNQSQFVQGEELSVKPLPVWSVQRITGESYYQPIKCESRTFHRWTYVSQRGGNLPLLLKVTDGYAWKNRLHVLIAHWASRDLPRKFPCWSRLSLRNCRMKNPQLIRRGSPSAARRATEFSRIIWSVAVTVHSF
jgi:hypothetical protein